MKFQKKSKFHNSTDAVMNGITHRLVITSQLDTQTQKFQRQHIISGVKRLENDAIVNFTSTASDVAAIDEM